MLSHSEASVEPTNRLWHIRHSIGLGYSDRVRAFRESLPNAREFVVHSRQKNLVPVRHLIVQAMLEKDAELGEETKRVYSGIEGASFRKSGSLALEDHSRYDSADETFFAHPLDHIKERTYPVDVKIDPFILFHLGKTAHPVILGYDTSKLVADENNPNRWTPADGETLSSAVDRVYHLSSPK